MNARRLSVLLISAVLLMLAGCGKRSSMVYVLEEPQQVTLIASASTLNVQRGETVVLHVERRTAGKWKQIPLSEVRSEQCWLYRPPTAAEPEVADNVHWEIAPANAVALNADFRMDHTKIATMNVKGVITLKPITPLKCETDRVVEGPEILIQVS